MSRVTALIPHYGVAGPTLQLIDQLRAQEHVAHLEIVVSDDCSPEPFPEGEGYVVVRRASNGGFGSNVNSAAAAAHGDLLLILNSDLTLTETFIADLLEAAAQHQPAVISPKVVEHGKANYTARRWPRARHHAWEWLTPFARIRHTGLWHRLVGHDLAAWASTRAVRTDWVMGACLLIPRDAFERVGGMDERFFMNSEEVDLQRRLTASGVPSVYLPEVNVEHAAGGSTPPQHRRGWVTDSRFQYAHKWGGVRWLRLLLRAATELNFMWNLTRELRRVPDVDARQTRRQEHALIQHAWRQRRGKDRRP